MLRRLLVIALCVIVATGALLASGRLREAEAPAQPPTQSAKPPATHEHDMAGMSTDSTARADHAGHAGHSGPIDWAAMSDRDLDVASIFLTARRAGVAAALDSLRALAARDSSANMMGHVVAHALGRFAVARSKGDPSVYTVCTQEFEAGCWHGVMEGYFTSARAAAAEAVTPRALDALCARIVRPGPARLPALECAHGMGHGLTARAGNDWRRALALCDALGDADARGECHDGVFMEVSVRGTEPRPGTNDATLVRANDLRYPCDSVAMDYQPSCWAYQPIIAIELTDDMARTARLCDEAPPGAIEACHRGFGKQATGWLPNATRVLDACRLGAAAFLGACVAGAAESYIDETWTPAKALALCRLAPASAKGACYSTVGARMALVRPGPAQVAEDCAGAEPAYVEVCKRGEK